MFRDTKREFLLNLDSLALLLAVEAGGWLFGVAFSIFITRVSDEELFILGRIFGLLSLGMGGVLVGCLYFSAGFDQALQMGCTRRRFLAGIAGALSAQLLCGLAAYAVLWAAEWGLGRLLLGAGYDEGKMAQWLPWLGVRLWLVPCVMAAILCFSAFGGACLHRWGRRAFWGLWVAGILLLMLVNLLHTPGSPLENALAPLGRLLGALPPAARGALGALAVALCGAVGIRLLWRDVVRGAT